MPSVQLRHSVRGCYVKKQIPFCCQAEMLCDSTESTCNRCNFCCRWFYMCYRRYAVSQWWGRCHFWGITLNKTFELIQFVCKYPATAKPCTKKGTLCEKGGQPDPPVWITFNYILKLEWLWMSLPPFSKLLTKQAHPFCPLSPLPHLPSISLEHVWRCSLCVAEAAVTWWPLWKISRLSPAGTDGGDKLWQWWEQSLLLPFILNDFALPQTTQWRQITPLL